VHMGGFFLYELFQHASLNAFEYMWRLDSDLLLLAPVHRDPFVQLEAAPRQHFLRPDANVFIDSSCLPLGLKATVSSTMAALMAARNTSADTVNGDSMLVAYATRLRSVIDGQAWEGCTAALRLSFFRSKPYLTVARAVYAHRDRFRHRWSEQVFFPLALAALAPPDAVSSLDVITAGCHGDHPGAMEAAMGRMYCEHGLLHTGMGWMARALNASATTPPDPLHIYHTIYAANYGACAIDYIDHVAVSASELLIYAHAHASHTRSRDTAVRNLKALAARLQILASSVGRAAVVLETE